MIIIKPVHKNISRDETVYVSPTSVISSTVSCGHIEVIDKYAIAHVSLYIRGDNDAKFFVLSNKEVPHINSPLVLPKFSLGAGQELVCETTSNISIMLTIGEQR